MAKSVKRILKSESGETIMEAVVSLLVFALLMLAVGTMIATSMRLTGNSNQRYRQLQASVKQIVEEDAAIYTINDKITFTVGVGTPAAKDYVQEIIATAEDNIVGFAPVVKAVPAP